MPARKLEHPFHYYLRNVVHKIRLSIDTNLEPYDISSQQARIVGFIGENQKSGASICQKDIERILNITGASVTSLLQGLERKGFIRRVRSAADDRVKELSLTAKGKDLIDVFNTIFDNTEKKITHGLSDDQKDQFLTLLHEVYKNFDL